MALISSFIILAIHSRVKHVE